MTATEKSALIMVERIKMNFDFDDYIGSFLFFNTGRQSTQLIFSNKEVYCVLHTFQGDKMTVKFRMRTKDLVDNIKNIKFEDAPKEWTPDNDGKFDDWCNH